MKRIFSFCLLLSAFAYAADEKVASQLDRLMTGDWSSAEESKAGLDFYRVQAFREQNEIHITAVPADCPRWATTRVFKRATNGTFYFVGINNSFATIEFRSDTEFVIHDLDFELQCTPKPKYADDTGKLHLKLKRADMNLCEAVAEASGDTRPKACAEARLKAIRLADEKCDGKGKVCEVIQEKALPEKVGDRVFTQRFCEFTVTLRCEEPLEYSGQRETSN